MKVSPTNGRIIMYNKWRFFPQGLEDNKSFYSSLNSTIMPDYSNCRYPAHSLTTQPYIEYPSIIENQSVSCLVTSLGNLDSQKKLYEAFYTTRPPNADSLWWRSTAGIATRFNNSIASLQNKD